MHDEGGGWAGGAAGGAGGSSTESREYLPGATLESDRRWALDRACMIMRKEADGGAGPDAGEAAKIAEPAVAGDSIALAVDPNNREYQNWLRKVKLGNPASETNQQLFENRASTLPDGAKAMTVEQALVAGEVEDVNVSKLLTDLREKFNK